MWWRGEGKRKKGPAMPTPSLVLRVAIRSD